VNDPKPPLESAVALQPAAPLQNAPRPRRNDSGLGIALMATGMFLFSLVDTQGKFLTDTLHPVQIVWSRQLGLVLGVLVVLAYRGVSILRTSNPALQIARGTMAAGSATLFIFAVSYVPLADAVAVSFVAPFIVTLLGALVLREPVGIRRWAAVSIGFLGTLVIIRPGLGAIHPAVMLVIAAAALFALRQVLSRVLSGGDRTVTTVAYTALTSSLILSVPLPFVWVWPTENIQFILLFSKALEVAQAVVVAPLHYTIMIWSTCWGFLVFGDLPDIWTWVGALIIVASGAYTLHRERVVSRRRH